MKYILTYNGYSSETIAGAIQTQADAQAIMINLVQLKLIECLGLPKVETEAIKDEWYANGYRYSDNRMTIMQDSALILYEEAGRPQKVGFRIEDSDLYTPPKAKKQAPDPEDEGVSEATQDMMLLRDMQNPRPVEPSPAAEIESPVLEDTEEGVAEDEPPADMPNEDAECAEKDNLDDEDEDELEGELDDEDEDESEDEAEQPPENAIQGVLKGTQSIFKKTAKQQASRERYFAKSDPGTVKLPKGYKKRPETDEEKIANAIQCSVKGRTWRVDTFGAMKKQIYFQTQEEAMQIGQLISKMGIQTFLMQRKCTGSYEAVKIL